MYLVNNVLENQIWAVPLLIWHMCGVLFWGILFKRLEIFDFVYFFGLFHDIFNFGHHHIINQGATNSKQTFSFPAGRNR